MLNNLVIEPGSPLPFGATLSENCVNFSVICPEANELFLCLWDPQSPQKLLEEISFNPQINRTGDVWHLAIHKLHPPVLYSYKVKSKSGLHPSLLDPNSKAVVSHDRWAEAAKTRDKYRPLGEIQNSEFDWEGVESPKIPVHELIIYEMHVRGFTQHPSSRVKNPGTYLGLVEKIPYLKELGINAVELLPIQEFDECEFYFHYPHFDRPLINYWGYSTINFFAPMRRYAAHPDKAIKEFKTMVKSFHQNGIEVILDVVFNHTGEGDSTGPFLSFKGLDLLTYYLFDPHNRYLNYSGCGNTFNCNQPITRAFILDCLRYWVTEMHIDGFRFDLASILTRDTDGEPIPIPPLIEAVTDDPILCETKLIAEPWDAAGLYQVGNFYPRSNRWSEWNDKYRDGVRKFIKGDPGTSGDFATRICGSEDLYATRTPCSSLNYITAHDGFTQADLVSYNHKHNMDNGEKGRDGNNLNYSWNCGVEGVTKDPTILALRLRQRKNFHFALMISQGIPMLLMGDEYGHTKKGNNNTWCQDNELNWFLWSQLNENALFFRFYQKMIAFRKANPIFQRTNFLTNADIQWHGLEPFRPDWSDQNHLVSYSLENFYIAFNMFPKAQTLQLPEGTWKLIVHTGNPSPDDFYETEQAPLIQENRFLIPHHTSILLQKSS